MQKMQKNVLRLALGCTLLLATWTAFASEVRKVFEMKDGSVVVGVVMDEGQTGYLVRTVEGETVRVAYDQVQAVTRLGGAGQSNGDSTSGTTSGDAAVADGPCSPPVGCRFDDEAEYSRVCGSGLEIEFLFRIVSGRTGLTEYESNPLWKLIISEGGDDRIAMVQLYSSKLVYVNNIAKAHWIPTLELGYHEARIRIENQQIDVYIDGRPVVEGKRTDSWRDDECINLSSFTTILDPTIALFIAPID